MGLALGRIEIRQAELPHKDVEATLVRFDVSVSKLGAYLHTPSGGASGSGASGSGASGSAHARYSSRAQQRCASPLVG